MRASKSIAVFQETRGPDNIVKEIEAFKNYLWASTLADSMFADPSLVCGLARAYLSLPAVETYEERKIIADNMLSEHDPLDGVYQPTALGPVRMHRTLTDHITFTSPHGKRMLELETTTVHDKRRYVPLLKFLSKHAFHEEPNPNFPATAILRVHRPPTPEEKAKNIMLQVSEDKQTPIMFVQEAVLDMHNPDYQQAMDMGRCLLNLSLVSQPLNR